MPWTYCAQLPSRALVGLPWQTSPRRAAKLVGTNLEGILHALTGGVVQVQCVCVFDPVRWVAHFE
jgi:hypothetical protein